MRKRWRSIGSGVVLLVLAAAPAACASGSTGGAGAQCVAPYLDRRAPSATSDPAAAVEPGDVLEVYGHWYTATCNDSGRDDPLEPLAPVRLSLKLPGGRTRSLGLFTPHGGDMGFRAVVRVPRRTPAGLATLRDDRQPRATFRFTVTAHPVGQAPRPR